MSTVEYATVTAANDSHRPDLRVGGGIVVVDDDEWVRGLVTGVLRAAGYQVHEYASALTALEFLRSPVGQRIDLLLSDVVLPGMHGYALADTVRRLRPHLPVLLMTGRLPALLPADDGGMGFGAILQKPIAPEALLRAVQSRLAA